MTPAFTLTRWLAAVAALASVAGCHARTDRESYEAGETGRVTLVNPTDLTGYLPGCQPFSYERVEDGAWVEQPPDFVCVWEGIPVPVPAHSELQFGFTARDPGRWRLRFDASVGCEGDRPLPEAGCTEVIAVSNDFWVHEPRGCHVSGCSGELCATEPQVSACAFLPHYVCFRDAVCSERGDLGPRPGCGFERTPELGGVSREFRGGALDPARDARGPGRAGAPPCGHAADEPRYPGRKWASSAETSAKACRPIRRAGIAWRCRATSPRARASRVCGRDIVAFRVGSGALGVLDAHCPHLGAHLGHGGRVVGEALRCPFHALHWGVDGSCVGADDTDVPGIRAKARAWPVRELHGAVLVYYSARGEPPSWEIPDPGMQGWGELRWETLRFPGHVLEVAENGVDRRHFRAVHSYTDVTEFEVTVDGPVLRSRFGFTKDGLAQRFDTLAYGLGYAITDLTIEKLGLHARVILLSN